MLYILHTYITQGMMNRIYHCTVCVGAFLIYLNMCNFLWVRQEKKSITLGRKKKTNKKSTNYHPFSLHREFTL